ncbi:AraC family transcriptional regulator [Pannonibacter sp. Q-1]
MHPNVDIALIKHVDDIPRDVVPWGFAGALEALEHSQRHSHRKGQLIYTARGVMNCEVDGAIWIAPSNCAVWIPSQLPHAVFGTGDVECFSFFIDERAAQRLPAHCCTVSVSPFLNELIRRASRIGVNYPAEGKDARLIAVFLDELADAPMENLRLPVPADPRLARLFGMMLDDIASRVSVGEWAGRVGMSERTLTRRLLNETGMSFGQLRRQMHIITSLRRLSAGETVQCVALDLGYDSASSFITMFRKAMGKAPLRYVADHLRAP